ncbi:HD domain-containing protein [Streptomyces sp. NEAU-sy36]|uniref:HD domain-containing protein n=1 Tax=unclassified Streptomyces TaxID=2593676 RepID=UPI0015D5D160|nr:MULTISPECIES: HD domain-containing protein [unclassified Streptomyces]QLJ00272.1 HD domain-containing protein [Streptomyces sp. NEAU-sy36]
MSDDLSPVANFLFEAGTLKHTARTGWWMAGVRQPETVAEHSWRTSLIASIIARMEGADPARAALLAVWHDTGETRTGDVNHLGKKYTDGEADPRDIAGDQVAGMPAAVADAVKEIIGTYEARDTPEAVCARDADKLECMIQGIEYRDQGYANAQRWIDNSRGRITTKSGQALADAVLATGSLDWLRAALGEDQR